MPWSDAFPQSLTIPAGAGPGDPRIELDGVTGKITIYGADPDSKIVLDPDGPTGLYPSINLQSVDNPGDVLAGLFDGGDGPILRGAEYVDFVHGELLRQTLRLSHFGSYLGGVETGNGHAEGGILTTSDSNIEISYYNNSGRVHCLRVGADGVRVDIGAGAVGDQGYLGRGKWEWTESAVASGAVAAGAEAVVLTIPASNYRADRAYEIRMVGGASGSLANSRVFWRLRKTNVAGAQLALWYRTDLQAAAAAYDVGKSGRYFTVGAADVNAPLVLTLIAEIGNVTHTVNAGAPRALEIWDVGPASLYTAWPVMV